MDKNKKGGAMNDFDFEELDKAVSSLAAKTKTENNLPATSASTPIMVTPAARRSSPAPASSMPPPAPRGDATPVGQSIAATATPSDPKPAVQPAVQHSKRLATTPPKRGAFMDIVAPNKATPRRTGTTLQPLHASQGSSDPKTPAEKLVQEPVADKAPVVLSEPEKTPNTSPLEAKNLEDHAPEIMANEVQAPEPEPNTTPKNASKHTEPDEPSWPDPLDFQDLEGKDKHSNEPQEDGQQPKPAPTQTSPFLPEARVEKRPLGAFSGFAPKHEESTGQHGAEIPTDAPELTIDDELTPESDGTFKEPETPKAPTMHDAPKEHTPEKAESKQDDAKPNMHTQAMMSIPKQYHTEEKPVDTAKRPIFDTKEYHPPLLEAAAHEHRGGNSMWSKLFIALATLVLLGVAGYFAYLYFVQQ